MFKIFENVTKSGKAISEFTLTELIETIRNNPDADQINEARLAGKKSSIYKSLKAYLKCYTPNSFSQSNWRSDKNSKRVNSTGYIYFDFDFDSKEQAIDYKEQVKNIPYVFASYLSLSELGLGILFKVDQTKVNLVNFSNYWSKINDTFFGGAADQRTKDFQRLNIISYDTDIYVNENVIEYSESVDYESGIQYETVLPYHLIDTTKPYTIVSHPCLKVDFYKLKRWKIKEGKRNSTLGAICMQLIFLNPTADYLQILNAVKSINRNYTVSPLTDKEINEIVIANWNKKQAIINNENGIINKYFKTKTVWFNPKVKLPLFEKRRIIGESKKILNFKKIEGLLKNQQFNSKSELIAFLLKFSISERSIYRFMENDTFCQINYINTKHNNDVLTKSIISPTEQKIYDAIEDLQDGNKITQERIAEYTSLSIITVKRNYKRFKDLVQTLNKSIKKIEIVEPEPLEEEFNGYYRNILNPLTNDKNFEQFIIELQKSKIYNITTNNRLLTNVQQSNIFL